MDRIALEELFNSADRDLNDGYFEAGVEKLEQILVEDPGFGKAYNHLGWLYETKFQDYEKAEGYYKLALEHAPNYAAVYTNFSILLSTLEKFDELEALLQKGLKVAGVNKGNIYYEYGIMYEKKGEFQKAIDQYRECAKSTLNKNTLKNATDSIERCSTKLNL